MSDLLTEKIIGAAIEVHRVLGPGLLESVYEEALCHELNLQGLKCGRQLAVEVNYKGISIKGQRLDLLVENEVVLEVKSLNNLPEVAMAQILPYFEGNGIEMWPIDQLR